MENLEKHSNDASNNEEIDKINSQTEKSKLSIN